MGTPHATGNTRLSAWLHVRCFAASPTMIETATARRLAGGWAGACAAAGFDTDLDPRAAARVHGGELAARLRAEGCGDGAGRVAVRLGTRRHLVLEVGGGAAQAARIVPAPRGRPLLGGGGTDLRAGFTAALRIRPRPDDERRPPAGEPG